MPPLFALSPEARRFDFIGAATLALLTVLPPVAAAAVILRYWLPLPVWDEWSNPAAVFVSWCNGTLSFADLFAQYNEGRKLFPNLLYLGLAQAGGWDVRKEMSLSFLSVCVMLFLFHRSLRVSLGAHNRAALLATCAASFIAFSPAHLQNFLWGVLVELYFPGLALLGMIRLNLSALPLTWKTFLNGMLALLATYTAPNGMLLWALGFPLPSIRETQRRRWIIRAAYLLCAAAVICLYFVGYTKPAYHPAFFGGKFEAAKLAHYIVLWIGSSLQSELVSPLIVGLAAIALLLGAGTGALLVLRRGGLWRSFYVPLVLIAYAGATAMITAAGRVGFGLEQALTPHYRIFSLSFYLGSIALLFALYWTHFREAPRPQRRLFQVGCALLAGAALMIWVSTYPRELSEQEQRHRRNLSLLRALQWIEIIPDNPHLKRLFPEPATLRERAAILRKHKVLKLPFVSPVLTQELSRGPSLNSTTVAGRITGCAFDENGNLHLRGRMQFPESDKGPDYILIGASVGGGPFKPVNVLDRSRQAGAEFEHVLDPANFPAGEITIAAWAVNLSEVKLDPLAGATLLPGKFEPAPVDGN